MAWQDDTDYCPNTPWPIRSKRNVVIVWVVIAVLFVAALAMFGWAVWLAVERAPPL